MAEFEAKGIRQADLTHKVNPENPGYWLHEVVRDFSPLAGVERRDARIVRDVWELRTTADYKNRDVNAESFQGLLPQVGRILEELGVQC